MGELGLSATMKSVLILLAPARDAVILSTRLSVRLSALWFSIPCKMDARVENRLNGWGPVRGVGRNLSIDRSGELDRRCASIDEMNDLTACGSRRIVR